MVDFFQDYDDDDESDEDVYVKPPPNKINVYRSNNKKRRKNVKRRKSSSDSDSESDEDGDFDGFTMSNMGHYFQRTYDTISDFVPAFPSIFGSDDDYDNDDKDKDDDSKKRNPKLQYPLYSKYHNNVEIHEKNDNRWFDKFFFGSEDSEETTPTSVPQVHKLTTESGFFSWLSGSGEVTTEKPVIVPQTEKNSKFILEFFAFVF